MINQEHKENTSEGLEADKKASTEFETTDETAQQPEETAEKAETVAEVNKASTPDSQEEVAEATKPKAEAVEEAVEAPTADSQADVIEATSPEVEAVEEAAEASTADSQAAVIEATSPEVEAVEEAAEAANVAQEDAAEAASPVAEAVAGPAEEEEEESEESHDEEHDEATYANMSEEELIELFVQTSKADKLSEVRSKMNILRGLLDHFYENERSTKLAAFLEAGNKEEDFAPVPSPLHLLFLETNTKYNQRRAKERESREQGLLDNYRVKQQLLEELHQLIEDEETKGITDIDKLRTIQQQWKDTGPVPPAHRNEQWQKYHFLIDKFYDNLRINRELKELDLQKNLEGKIELCEKAEELLLENSIKLAIEQLNGLHEQWKALGPVPREQKESIWERFKAASDKVYDKRKSYFQQLDEERGINLEKKEALCVQLEQMLENSPKDHQGWSKLNEEIEKIQSIWKSIGFAPKAQNTTIWRRFKASVDKFYTDKNLFYRNVRTEQIDNMRAKEALCEQAESLMHSEDWKATTDAIIALQKAWKKIGPVNRKQSDKIWNRFRQACDHFFTSKNEHFGSQESRQEDNLKAKLELIESIEQFTGSGNQKDDLDALKDFQRKWMEIGFIPIKQKADVNERYRKALNAHFDSLKISQNEKTKLNFQNKIETLKSGKDSDKALRKEQFQIQTRISHLKNDILLWENNMGFFAQSKNADMLKKEIEQKIEKARNEIEQLNQKLLLLRDA
ncbi:MAG: DUF349 domain-containing protein [Bacteroidia bacterium]